jgi:acetamidase/formamidase
MQTLRDIYDRVTDKGPAHILTGPVYVEGAEPGTSSEVRILEIDLPLDYGYNGCRGSRQLRNRGGRLFQLDRAP